MIDLLFDWPPDGGLIDLIEPGVNGLLVPPGDPVALAEAMRSLLDRPEDVARLSEEARITALYCHWKDLHDRAYEPLSADAEASIESEAKSEGAVQPSPWWELPNDDPHRPWLAGVRAGSRSSSRRIQGTRLVCHSRSLHVTPSWNVSRENSDKD